MPPITLLNYKGDNAKIVSVGSNTMQISGGNVSSSYRHAHTRKSSSPISPAYCPRRVKSRVRVCSSLGSGKVSRPFYYLPLAVHPFTTNRLASLFSAFMHRRRDTFVLSSAAWLGLPLLPIRRRPSYFPTMQRLFTTSLLLIRLFHLDQNTILLVRDRKEKKRTKPNHRIN